MNNKIMFGEFDGNAHIIQVVLWLTGYFWGGEGGNRAKTDPEVFKSRWPLKYRYVPWPKMNSLEIGCWNFLITKLKWRDRKKLFVRYTY